jgi:phosphatidylserine/phosphatidylglycerophosphate/cardiolipin synthase-like enzyme
MPTTDWLLTASERQNPATRLDHRHGGDVAWTRGNDVVALVHGGSYFPELARCVQRMQAGDLLLFTDWRGDPDQRVNRDGELTISDLFADAAARGVVVKGLVWRSHLDRFSFSEQENRHLGEKIEQAGGECLRDMRVLPGGSHHQKFVVLRHPGRPDEDVAFVGGIDLCHSRFDHEDHEGDPQRQPMAKIYGSRPPWHDIQLKIHGPAVGDVEAVFRERWEDPAPLTRNPVNVVADLLRHEDRKPDRLPPQLPDPSPRGHQTVQLLRTYPRRRRGYPFAPKGERSVAHANRKVLSLARDLIYLEDQYFWSADVARCFVAALERQPRLRMIVVIPRFPDQDGRFAVPPHDVGRHQAVEAVRSAGGDRVAFYSPENRAGVPVYVHAKVCVMDDFWCTVGSDNVNLRSWTHDSELACAVVPDEDVLAPTRTEPGSPAPTFAAELRLRLAREHLDRADGDDRDLRDPADAFDAFAESARRLDAWVRSGRTGSRPAGRLRPYALASPDPVTRLWATPLYRTLLDPDARPRRLRGTAQF